MGLAVALAYAWLGRFDAPLAVTIELMVGALLWSGHLAWVDPRWRSLRRVGVPLMVASGSIFLLAYAVALAQPLGRWQLGMLGLGCGIAWWAVFSLARRISSRAAWSLPDRVSGGAESARRNLLGATTVEEIASAVVAPLNRAFNESDGETELYTLEPSLRIALGAGDRVTIRSAEVPEPILKEVFAGEQGAILDFADLRTRVVREPAIRPLVEIMEARSVGAIVPCMHDGHVEGLLLVPLAGRSETLSLVDREELVELGGVLGGALASALAQRRAEIRIHRLSTLHREAERRIGLLEGEVEQLRGQCHVLGRGLAEDQTLHVAYSPSMRRVQTRAIELAPLDEPVLLVAPAGSPLLPVSRFIHDRGPRWEAPFVVADCSAASPDQVMALLFGSQEDRYAGWFHSATGGTLLLRDLPALPMPAQARLAAALCKSESLSEHGAEEQPIPPRILATSRIPASELRRRDALDGDLAALLSGRGLAIPALRERREDIPSLVLLAIDRACRILARDPVGIDQDAMEALIAHDWPGDVAELELVISLAVSKTSAKTIPVRDLPPLAWPETAKEEPLDGTYLEVERRLLERALQRAGGNKSEAARLLGLKRTTFLDKLRRHGLEQRARHDMGGSAVR
ncbi:MAG: hypothetical protein AMJ62_12890 [Myxococcales bacterium SG8_38]|nr:MAG: hypothetical protein AMJ62_12890 [Myxococcales bacterium SG8_38]